MPPNSPHCYRVAYQPQPALVRGTVLCPLSAVELTESCELVLDTAQRYGCPFWLLDGRVDVVGNQLDVYDWMREEFFPRTYQVLGRIPYVAFLAQPALWENLKARHYAPLDPVVAPVPFRTSWFVEEADALAWLAQFRPTIGVP